MVLTGSPKVIFRCGSQIGDDIYVTGNMGNAAAFYFQATSNYIRPVPPVDFAVSVAAPALRVANVASKLVMVALAVAPSLTTRISPVSKSEMVSVPNVTLNVSFPPEPPLSVSSPALPFKVSSPAPPVKSSSPVPPLIVKPSAWLPKVRVVADDA